MLQARVTGTERNVQLMIDELLSPEMFSKAFATKAREIIGQQDDVNRRAFNKRVPYRTFVDGAPSVRLETARRVIVAEWNLLHPMLRDIDDMLRYHAPVLRGVYRDSITLFANDIPIKIGPTLPEAAEYYFAATVAYARKIERGLSSQAPNGVFEAVTAVAKKRYGNLARIKFGFRSLRGGAVGAWAARAGVQSRSNSRNADDPRRQDWLTRQPAIIITPR